MPAGQAAAQAAPSAAPAAAPSRPAPAPSGGQGIAKRLVITSGAKEGLELDLPSEVLTIGRSGESGLVIRDDYTSTHHARLLLWNEGWVIQDLDSTNGTYLDGQRVTTPVLVPLNTPVKIGTTSFELRR
jgi:pSer/pThr/pTyr-binding forkhead associated (FHA) protein